MIATGQPSGMVEDCHADHVAVIDFFPIDGCKGKFIRITIFLASFKNWFVTHIHWLADIILKLTPTTLVLHSIENGQSLRGAFSAICHAYFPAYSIYNDTIPSLSESDGRFRG